MIILDAFCHSIPKNLCFLRYSSEKKASIIHFSVCLHCMELNKCFHCFLEVIVCVYIYICVCVREREREREREWQLSKSIKKYINVFLIKKYKIYGTDIIIFN